MSTIVEQIERLQDAKTAIKNAIEQKGVTVGDGTIDTYAELISQITGGEVETDIGGYKRGTVDITDTSKCEFSHNLGVIPKIVVLWTEHNETTTDALEGYVYTNMTDTPIQCVYEVRSSGNGVSATPNSMKELTEDVARVGYRSANYKFVLGAKYNWLVWSDEADSEFLYEQGFEDGKNSVVQIDRWVRGCTLVTLNMFKTPVAELNFDNWSNNSFLNFLNVNTAEHANTTVEHLTINAPNVSPTSMQQILYCSKAEAADKKLKHLTFNINTENVTTFSYAFGRLTALEIIDGQPFNFSSATTGLHNMFNLCSSLIEFRVVPETIKVSFNVASSSNLDADTIQNIINGLANLTGNTTQTLTVHQTVRNKLTDDQLLQLSNKNWGISPAEATN